MGGVESHCEQLLPRLKAHCNSHDFTVIARRPYTPASSYDYEGIRVVPLPAARGRYSEAISNTLLAVLYARFFLHAELLHIHAIGPALCGPLARLLGMKLIVTHHSNNFEHSKWNRLAKIILRIGAWCAVAASDKVIVVSQSLTKELEQRYPTLKHKIEYIPNGATILPVGKADVETGKALLERYDLKSRKYVIAVGRLVPEKGFHDLIAAFREMDSDFKLVIVGKADHHDSYAESLLRHASDRIIFTGFQDQAILRSLYADASLFVLPSYHEGLPIAALEAGAMGLPLVLSDIQPNLDIGLPAGNYFPVGDTVSLRRKLLENHNSFRVDPEEIAKRFDWDVAAEATADVYASVLGERLPDVSCGPSRSLRVVRWSGNVEPR
jgi:glycosyltransferase involved in cell wall biosynthesis